jgi:hypothetical protein
LAKKPAILTEEVLWFSSVPLGKDYYRFCSVVPETTLVEQSFCAIQIQCQSVTKGGAVAFAENLVLV